jgi:TolA-binding protein
MSKVTAAKTKGRLTKQELKQDRLVKLAYQTEHFYLQHQKWVIGAAIGVLAIVLGVVIVRKTIESNKLEAAYTLTMAKMNYGSSRLDEAKASFQRIVTNQGGATAAEAKYFLARIAFDQGNYTQASDEFKAYLKDFSGDDELDCAAMSGLASTYEALNNPEEAAKTFLQVAEKFPNNPYAAEALWEASRIYIKLNQTDNAQKALLKIRDNYSTSSVMGQVRRSLEALQ